MLYVQHPFVAGAADDIRRNGGVSTVLKQLIDENFATIEESRMRGAESEEDGVESVPDGEEEPVTPTTDDAGSQSGGTGTIRRPRPVGSASNTGTMQRNLPSSGTMRQLKTGVCCMPSFRVFASSFAFVCVAQGARLSVPCGERSPRRHHRSKAAEASVMMLAMRLQILAQWCTQVVCCCRCVCLGGDRSSMVCGCDRKRLYCC